MEDIGEHKIQLWFSQDGTSITLQVDHRTVENIQSKYEMTEALIMLVEIGAITREDTEWIIEHLESIDFPEVRPFRAAVCTLTVPISKLNQTLGTYWRVIQSPIADIAIGLAFLIK